MNILIKLTCLIGLVIAPILGGHSLDSDHTSADHEIKKEVIIESDNDVWTMSVTTEENGATKQSEIISGTKDEVMSEADKRGIAAMGQINKK
jgi:K(+)-stimulated pyrophosphate-energized sodium pump